MITGNHCSFCEHDHFLGRVRLLATFKSLLSLLWSLLKRKTGTYSWWLAVSPFVSWCLASLLRTKPIVIVECFLYLCRDHLSVTFITVILIMGGHILSWEGIFQHGQLEDLVNPSLHRAFIASVMHVCCLKASQGQDAPHASLVAVGLKELVLVCNFDVTMSKGSQWYAFLHTNPTYGSTYINIIDLLFLAFNHAAHSVIWFLIGWGLVSALGWMNVLTSFHVLVW